MGMACAGGASAFMAMASWRASLDLVAGVPHVAAAALEVGVVMVTGCTMVCERAAEMGSRKNM
jgi:hypothetical protein